VHRSGGLGGLTDTLWKRERLDDGAEGKTSLAPDDDGDSHFLVSITGKASKRKMTARSVGESREASGRERSLCQVQSCTA